MKPPADYDVIVEPGALRRLPAFLAETAPAHHYLLIADGNLAELHGRGIVADLERAGLRVSLITFPPGEEQKTRETWSYLIDQCTASGAGRDSVVLALGGGVTGDLAGFVAATFLRGVPVVQLPTSLLAMLDSSVGGKTGVDTPAGKNLVGAFHSPCLVVVDPEVISTLPPRELRAGLAEGVKHGAIADEGYFDWIAGASHHLLAADADALSQLVRRSVEIKAEFATADPFETGPRKALNFGHTIGHALEALSGYQIPHGFAVAIGMVAEARIGQAIGVTEEGTASRLEEALKRLELPVRIPPAFPAERIIELTRTDKKARAGRTRYSLITGIGTVARAADGAWSHEVDELQAIGTLAVSLYGNEV